MKVYSVLLSKDYEGLDLLGVFGDRDSALAFIGTQEGYQKKWYGGYGVVESELGQRIDSDSMIEYVD